jgi:F-type H+-transporting ATPase subunit b
LAQLGLNLGYLVVQIGCFLIVLVVVNAWIVKPLKGLLERRRKTITQSVEDARIAAEARANAEKEAERIINEAQLKAAHLVNDATGRADAAMEEVKAGAEKEIEGERNSVLAEVAEERNRILADLRGQVAALSIAAAQKLIGESMDEKRQHALLDEFFSGIKSGKLVMLEGTDLTGESAEVTSALPLSQDEQGAVRKNVLVKMGTDAKVEFVVNPQILGGLVIRVGDKVIDGSVAGQLEGLRKSLK